MMRKIILFVLSGLMLMAMSGCNGNEVGNEIESSLLEVLLDRTMAADALRLLGFHVTIASNEQGCFNVSKRTSVYTEARLNNLNSEIYRLIENPHLDTTFFENIGRDFTRCEQTGISTGFTMNDLEQTFDVIVYAFIVMNGLDLSFMNYIKEPRPENNQHVIIHDTVCVVTLPSTEEVEEQRMAFEVEKLIRLLYSDGAIDETKIESLITQDYISGLHWDAMIGVLLLLDINELISIPGVSQHERFFSFFLEPVSISDLGDIVDIDRRSGLTLDSEFFILNAEKLRELQSRLGTKIDDIIFMQRSLAIFGDEYDDDIRAFGRSLPNLFETKHLVDEIIMATGVQNRRYFDNEVVWIDYRVILADPDGRHFRITPYVASKNHRFHFEFMAVEYIAKIDPIRCGEMPSEMLFQRDPFSVDMRISRHHLNALALRGTVIAITGNQIGSLNPVTVRTGE